MKSFTQILVVLVLLLSLVATVISDRLSSRYFEAQAAPLSAFDMAIESRTTAPAEAGNKAALGWGIALVAGLVLTGVGIVASLSNGGEFLRQLRLSRKRQRPRHPTQPTISELPTVPQMRRLAAPIEDGYYQE